ncbi:peptidoglycan editing factor PgeF [Paraglaciecola aquimarina]|uniref:Purine nucleoside phosphorylase n=1 Tax=Paraglaciecola algarum TaxID=3050085 RepID=A0ABS9DA83_9ALTE|nr:peptidoglycan editing factor PgeF [Paraglaciecola sp. G1-23]MCF2949828.1 peptidoglycan editing factor PgeF [Paraglaciecola sp. G1-23]
MLNKLQLADRALLKPGWPAPENIVAYTSTRKGGYSSVPFDSLNLGQHVFDDPSVVAKNRSLLPNYENYVWLKQTHSTKCVNLADMNNTDSDQVEADASYTSLKQRVCAVMTADCLPILVCDKQATKVAAIHAGWRGLADGVIENTISKLQLDTKNIMAWIGPAISQAHFEVGQEVKDTFSDYPQAFKPNIETSDNKYFVDMYLIAKQKLSALGIQNIYGGDRCTYAESDLFFSHRRATHQGLEAGFAQVTTGRMVSAIYIKQS